MGKVAADIVFYNGLPTGSLAWVDFTGQTPFLTASLSGDLAVMKLLLKHGADPKIPTFGGTTALMAAAGNGSASVFRCTTSDEFAHPHGVHMPISWRCECCVGRRAGCRAPQSQLCSAKSS